MGRSEQPAQGEWDRGGLAVPIALLAFIVVGVLVTGAFYAWSMMPAGPQGADVSLRQPVPGPRPALTDDSLPGPGVAAPADTTVSVMVPGHEPAQAAMPAPQPRESAAEHVSESAVGETPSIPAHRPRMN